MLGTHWDLPELTVCLIVFELKKQNPFIILPVCCPSKMTVAAVRLTECTLVQCDIKQLCK